MKDKFKTPLNFSAHSSDFLISGFFHSKIRISIIIVLIFTIVFTSGCQPSHNNNKSVSKSTFVLNTVISITLYDTDDESLIDRCFDLCKQYELIFSRTDENSELYKLNNSDEADVSEDLIKVINDALYYCKLSEGSFDITLGNISDMYGFSTDNPKVPSSEILKSELSHVDYNKITVNENHIIISDPDTVIDLGSIAKGFIADKLKEFLISKGIKSGIINLGGNVLCIGGKPDGSNFGIGIQKPFGKDSDTIARVNIKDMSVVTSGIYERCFYENGKLYHHILNSETGLPVNNNLLSVTIIGKNSETCDVLSTTAFVMGPDFINTINKMKGYYALFVDKNYNLTYSSGFEKLLN